MPSLINTGGGAESNVLIHDLEITPGLFLTEAIDVSGDGEIRSVRIESAVLVDTGIRAAGGPWRIHDHRIRTDDEAMIIDANDSLITASYLSADNDWSLVINGDRNVIGGCILNNKGLLITGDDNTFAASEIQIANGTGNGIRIEGNRNFIDATKIFQISGSLPPVGIEIISGATDNVIGTNGITATTPITDAGTGTRYRNHKALAPPFVAGVVATAIGVARLRIPEDAFIIDAAAMVNTAPTDADLIVDVHLNGTTIFASGKPTIAATAFDSGLAIPTVRVAAAGQYFTVDVDQVGSTIAGSDLTVVIRYVPVGAIG